MVKAKILADHARDARQQFFLILNRTDDARNLRDGLELFSAMLDLLICRFQAQLFARSRAVRDCHLGLPVRG